MRVRLHSKPKPDNYTESCMVDVAEGKSIFAHNPGGKVAEGYRNLTKEVLKLEKQREKSRAGIGR